MQKTSVLRWKGVCARVRTRARIMCAAVLVLACAMPSFTQWGFLGFQLPSGSVAYLIFLLIPVALSALLLGTLFGAGIGLCAGLVLYAHSIVAPLDYFELVYVTPITSMGALAACGLALGILLAAVLRRCPVGLKRMAGVALSCAVASCVHSAFFCAGNQVAVQTDALAFQIVGNTVIMLGVILVALLLCGRYLSAIQNHEMRVTFGFWLFTLVLTVFLAIVIVAYGAVTVREYNAAVECMRSNVTSLAGQIRRADEFDRMMVNALLQDTDKTIDEAWELMDGGSLKNLLDGYDETEDGLVVVSFPNAVLGSNSERLSDAQSLSECFDDDVLAAADQSVKEGTPKRVIFLAPASQDDWVRIREPSDAAYIAGNDCTPQVGYLMAMETGGYRITTIMSAGLVFQDRDDVMEWAAILSLVLLVVMLVSASVALDRLVVRRIDATNETLALITTGDLSKRVEAKGMHEFISLAKGINATVNALEGWIAEAERRMETELATAKAIQEGVLPSLDAPVLADGAIDLYATMKTAKEVGGDFYDFFELPDGRLCVVIADVSDKGVPAALFMMRAKQRIHDTVCSGAPLAEAMVAANSSLCEGNPAMMFVTAFVGVLDQAAGELEFVNAGHNPPLLRRRGTWLWLRSDPQFVLGSFDGFSYRSHTVRFEPGDMLMLYTDGVNEEENEADELYGNKRFMAFARALGDESSRETVDALIDELARWRGNAEQTDDITVLALRSNREQA